MLFIQLQQNQAQQTVCVYCRAYCRLWCGRKLQNITSESDATTRLAPSAWVSCEWTLITTVLYQYCICNVLGDTHTIDNRHWSYYYYIEHVGDVAMPPRFENIRKSQSNTIQCPEYISHIDRNVCHVYCHLTFMIDIKGYWVKIFDNKIITLLNTSRHRQNARYLAFPNAITWKNIEVSV